MPVPPSGSQPARQAAELLPAIHQQQQQQQQEEEEGEGEWQQQSVQLMLRGLMMTTMTRRPSTRPSSESEWLPVSLTVIYPLTCSTGFQAFIANHVQPRTRVYR